MELPQYLIDAAYDETGEYPMFLVRGTHPPQWMFDPTADKKSAAILSEHLIQENEENYRWNIIRRLIVEFQTISDEQYRMLIEEVNNYHGEETEWFLACRRFVRESINI